MCIRDREEIVGECHALEQSRSARFKAGEHAEEATSAVRRRRAAEAAVLAEARVLQEGGLLPPDAPLALAAAACEAEEEVGAAPRASLVQAAQAAPAAGRLQAGLPLDALRSLLQGWVAAFPGGPRAGDVHRLCEVLVADVGGSGTVRVAAAVRWLHFLAGDTEAWLATCAQVRGAVDEAVAARYGARLSGSVNGGV